MNRIYLDNAATTPLDEQVFDAMKPFLMGTFGNPSSIHTHGREVRSAIEKARKKVADLLHTSPSEIFFTSGGTEADNTFLHSTVETKGIRHVISTAAEHHAVLHTLQHLEKEGKIKLSLLDLDHQGVFEMDQLETLLKQNPNSLVSLMHGNNEIGNLIDLNAIGAMCAEYGALFHSDTVQTMAHYPHDLENTPIHSIVGAAHKFHGPKGVGFLYLKAGTQITPFIHGGAQERNMRGGTENVYGIIGLAKAMEIAYEGMESHRKHIEGLKARMIAGIKEAIPEAGFNGLSGDLDKSLYTVLNVCLPPSEVNDMLLFNLDIQKISASGGSACSSGSNVGSHVLQAIGMSPERGAVRFSFSKLNTPEEIDYTVEKLAALYAVKA